MKKIYIITILLACCIFANNVILAQNPFLERANVIVKFNVSPNENMLAYNLWDIESKNILRLKNISTNKITDIDVANLKTTPSMLSDLIDISNKEVLFIKDRAVYLYNIKSDTQAKLYNVNALPLNHCVSLDRKILYVLSGLEETLYALNAKSGEIIDSVKLEERSYVIAIRPTKDNGIVLSIRDRDNTRSLCIWDREFHLTDITHKFNKLIKNPYLITPTSDNNVWIVAGSDGMFMINTLTNIASKLIDNSNDIYIIEIRISENNRVIYYKTRSKSDIIQRFEIGKGSLDSIAFD